VRIDVHADYWTDDYLDLLVDLGKTDTNTQRGMGAGGGAELDARLRLGSWTEPECRCRCSPPLRSCPTATTATRRLRQRFVNDQYAELVARHPDRFRAFAAIPMPHVDESIAEMSRALDDLGMVGVDAEHDRARPPAHRGGV